MRMSFQEINDLILLVLILHGQQRLSGAAAAPWSQTTVRLYVSKLVKLQLTFLSFLSFLHFRLDSWFQRATFMIHLVIPLVINCSKLLMLQFSRIDCGFAPL